MNKICFKCNKTKPLEEFYKHPRMADGHVNKCKECNRLENKLYKRNNIEMHDVARKKYVKSERYRELLKSQAKKHGYKFPEKTRARQAVARAIKRQKLVKEPCFCGESTVQAHHDDYTRKLDIRWLCVKHHRDAHGWLTLPRKKYDT